MQTVIFYLFDDRLSAVDSCWISSGEEGVLFGSTRIPVTRQNQFISQDNRVEQMSRLNFVLSIEFREHSYSYPKLSSIFNWSAFQL
jgi:hypothetical protein